MEVVDDGRIFFFGNFDFLWECLNSDLGCREKIIVMNGGNIVFIRWVLMFLNVMEVGVFIFVVGVNLILSIFFFVWWSKLVINIGRLFWLWKWWRRKKS